ncbi:MAG: hypothetical protein H6744_16290 [Deltaproteobacteria bacterium]|nr:hypothetical protein [Deltaproteobacteria bacterium]
MRNLIGLEMMCFGRSRQFELTYEGGAYLDDKGEPVTDLLDLACLECTTSFYTREGDAIGYCPNCGSIERKRFEEREDLVSYLATHDLSWARRAGRPPVTAQTHDGDWRLIFARDPEALVAAGRFRAVRAL